MTTTDPVRRRAHAAAAARIGVVGIASSMTFGLIAAMGASQPAADTPAAPVPEPVPPPTTAPPAPVVIVIRRHAAAAATPAPGPTVAPRPAPARRAAPVAAPAPVTRTSAS